MRTYTLGFSPLNGEVILKGTPLNHHNHASQNPPYGADCTFEKQHQH